MRNQTTSWNKVGKWYHQLVGDQGHYYHQHVVLPKTLQLLALKPGDKVLDLGCGQGVLARQLPKGVGYTGLDSAAELVKAAQKADSTPGHTYLIADATKTLSVPTNFTHVTLILALQNMDNQAAVIANAAKALKPGGKLIIVLNHPAFRIPRQSSWEIDPGNKLQYRRVNRYLSPLKIPINMHPGDRQSELTWTFHHPLSDYFTWLKQAGCLVETLEEWSSDKESVGKAAKMENMSRAEFPLFLALSAQKK